MAFNKRITFALLSILFCGFISAQNNNLKENINLKLGVIGGWLAYEKPISNNFLVDAELGYTGGIINGDFIFTTTIELEPRYYYNISKRAAKGKSTKNNSANYISLQFSYFPDFLTATELSNVEILRSLNVIPSYGLRRNITGNLNFDFEIGLGYQFVEDSDNGLVPNLTLALSYVF